MKWVLTFLICFVQSLSCSVDRQKELADLYIDFETSMHQGYDSDTYESYLRRKAQRKYLSFLEEHYEESSFLTKFQAPTIRVIPRIIHQIWLGSPMPERYRKFQESWKRFHPDWEYRLWTDADVKPFHLINQKAFDESKTYAEKANIFRYEILDRFGGLYVDTDFECLASFDLLHEYYEFYAGIAPISRITLINNALIGSIPAHPILRACIKTIGRRNYGFGQMGRNGTIYFGEMVVDTCRRDRTLDLSRILIAPPNYFYPHTKESGLSFAIHYWDSNWQGQKYK